MNRLWIGFFFSSRLFHRAWPYLHPPFFRPCYRGRTQFTDAQSFSLQSVLGGLMRAIPYPPRNGVCRPHLIRPSPGPCPFQRCFRSYSESLERQRPGDRFFFPLLVLRPRRIVRATGGGLSTWRRILFDPLCTFSFSSPLRVCILSVCPLGNWIAAPRQSIPSLVLELSSPHLFPSMRPPLLFLPGRFSRLVRRRFPLSGRSAHLRGPFEGDP